MTCYLAAAIQMNSSADKEKNLDVAVRLLERAARRGAALIVLPELFNCLAEPQWIVEQAEPVPGPTCDLMSQLAAEHRVTLVAGSIAERVSEGESPAGKVYNTSVIWGPDGQRLGSIARYISLRSIYRERSASVRPISCSPATR